MNLFVHKHPSPHTIAAVTPAEEGAELPAGYELMSEEDFVAWRDAELAEGWVAAPLFNLTGLVSEVKGLVQASLDALAVSWGYDSVISCASYAASTIPQYAAEAASIIEWRDTLWSACYAALDAFDPEMSDPPTAGEFVETLPSAPARPEA
jgi:hypothetical protein